MRILSFLLAAGFAIVVLWVALANAGQEVTITLGTGGVSRTLSMAEVIFGSVLAGVFFVGLLAVVEGITLRVENLRLKRRLHQLEEEVLDLRNIAISGTGALPSGRAVGTVPASSNVLLPDDEP
jgi:TRAP-type C4-dicarboxylate transport system permease small subunit